MKKVGNPCINGCFFYYDQQGRSPPILLAEGPDILATLLLASVLQGSLTQSALILFHVGHIP